MMNKIKEYAKVAVQRGEDMEQVAKDLTEALVWVVTEGVGDEQADEEMQRLWQLTIKKE
jgi:hypothetical protein